MKIQNTQKRTDTTHESFEDKVNEIDQMFDFGIISKEKRDAMHQDLMGSNVPRLNTWVVTFRTGHDSSVRHCKIKTHTYKEATSALFKMYPSVNTSLISCIKESK